MSRKIDLTGKRFGRLLVLYETPKDKRPNPKLVFWHCKCDCGKEKDIDGAHLRRGATQSCGCLNRERVNEYNHSDRHKEAVSNSKMINEVGNRYGKLVVIKKAPNRRYGSTAWLCKCDCGNEFVATGRDLRRGDTQSCGCLKSVGEEVITKLLIENNVSFVREKTFQDCVFPKTQGLLRFDFYIEDKFLVEFDGEQHYNKSNAWYRKEYDDFKNLWAQEHHIPLIRVTNKQLSNLKLEDLYPKEVFKK